MTTIKNNRKTLATITPIKLPNRDCEWGNYCCKAPANRHTPNNPIITRIDKEYYIVPSFPVTNDNPLFDDSISENENEDYINENDDDYIRPTCEDEKKKNKYD